MLMLTPASGQWFPIDLDRGANNRSVTEGIIRHLRKPEVH
jgi:hypothetical protein